MGGHDELERVPLDCRRHGQCNTRIATGGLDQDIAGFDFATLLRPLNHAHGGPVLHRAGRVVPLQLEQDGIAGIRAHALQAHERRIADAVFDSGIVWHAAGIIPPLSGHR